MRYIKIKMDVSEENYFMVQKAIKMMLDRLQHPDYHTINSWSFKE